MDNDLFKRYNMSEDDLGLQDIRGMSNNDYLDILNEIDDDDEKKSAGLMKNLFEAAIYIAISVLIIILVKEFVVQHVKVDGDSMYPTLCTNEHLIIEKLSYKFNEVERFDIVVFKPYDSNDDVYYIKRIIGLPGETVSIEDNNIYINGVTLVESYGGTTSTEKKEMIGEVILGENEYFVLGDNRTVSKDSRDSSVGAVNKDSIVGKAFYCVYPFSRFGSIDDFNE